MHRASRRLVCVVAVIGLALLAAGSGAVLAVEPAAGTSTLQQRRAPLIVENRGQAAAGTLFYAAGRNARVSFGRSQITLEPHGSAPVRVRFAGGALVRPRGEDRLVTQVNLLKGPRADWITGIPTYGRVAYRNVWPGIGVSVAAEVQQLKYTYAVAPGADARQIRLRYFADAVRTDRAGRLVIRQGRTTLRDAAPRAYQGDAAVRSRYTVMRVPGANAWDVGFALGRYDQTRPLVIDPAILVYSGFLGGNDFDEVAAVAADTAGFAYIAGSSSSTDLPTSQGAFQGNKPKTDAFVAKVAADGQTLLYLTYLGGDQSDKAYGITIASFATAVVTGSTSSPNFPVKGAYDAQCGTNGQCNGVEDAFVTRLNASGKDILYSTFLGGNNKNLGAETGDAVAGLSKNGVVYAAGFTTAPDFPTQAGVQMTKKQGEDGWVAKLDTGKTGAASLVWSTFLGSVGNDSANAVAVGGSGDPVVTGRAGGDGFPLKNAFQSTHFGVEAFATRIAAGGGSLLWSTYLGGSEPINEFATSAAVDSSGNAYVGGLTKSLDFPVSPGAFQTTCGDDVLYGFVAKFAPGGERLWVTCLGGDEGYNRVNGLAADDAGLVYAAGPTMASDFPVTPDTFDKTCGTDGQCDGVAPNAHEDAFVVVLAPDGTSMTWGTFVGGSGGDLPLALDIGKPGHIFFAGQTFEAGVPYPTTPSAWDTTYGGGITDGFVTKFELAADIAVDITSDDPDPVIVPGDVLYKLQVKNKGPLDATDVLLVAKLSSKAVFEITSIEGLSPCTVALNKKAFTCDLGDMAPGAASGFAVQVAVKSLPAKTKTTLVLTADATANEPDPEPANNADKETTTLQPS